MLNINTINQKMNELKLIKHNSLIGLVDCLLDGNYRLKPNILPDKGAVYAFWWTGSPSYLKSNEVNRVIRFKGPNSRKVNVEFTDSWLDSISFEGRIPLYVGKTADSLKKRISLHLQLNLRRGLSLGLVH